MKHSILKCLSVLILLSVIFLNSGVYAALMTNTELDTAIETFETKLKNELAEDEGVEASEIPLEVTRNGDEITVTFDEDTMKFKYDFTTGHDFYTDVTYTSEMDFDESISANEMASTPMYGFLIIATNAGNTALDATAYMTLDLLSELDFTESDIITEENATNGVEFAKLILENAEDLEKDLYTYKTTKVSETADEIVIRTTISIADDADFSIVEGAMERLEDLFTPEEDPDEEESVVTPTPTPTPTQKPTTSTTQKEWPKAGIDNTLVNVLKVTVGLAVVALVSMVVLKKKTVKN